MLKIISLAVLIAVLAGGAAFADGSRLVVGDVIGVVVDGEEDFSKTYQIDRNGSITMPMIKDQVKLIGLNTSDAAAVITKALCKVLVNPQVTVNFVERARMRVFVVGQVSKTGLQEIGVGEKVLQALSQAGYDDTADLSRVNVRRGDQIIDIDLTKYLSGTDLNVNIELESGDTVVVPRSDTSGSVIVTGAVVKTGSFPIKRGMTFRDLMGVIGGVKPEADTTKITIKRDGILEPIKLDYDKAITGDISADIVLQTSDTISVPEVEKAYYTIMGGVQRPGQYVINGKMTISESIGLAGGAIPNVGDLRKVQIMYAKGPDAKEGQTVIVDIDEMMKKSKPEPLVKAGDVIYVPVHREKPSFLNVLQSISPLAWLFRF